MAGLDKFLELSLDLVNGKVTTKNQITLYNVDKNVFNVYLTLQKGKSGTILNADLANYATVLTVIKPKSKQYREFTGVVDGSEDRLKFVLGDEFSNQVGKYAFEFSVTNGEEVITSSPGAYNVTGSILTGLNAEIESNPDLPVLKELIRQMQELGAADLSEYQKKTDATLTTTNKTIVGAINELKTSGGGVSTDSIVDNLTSTDATKVLSAKQGKVLNDAKVDKITGKGLSTNDYTTAEKSKLEGLSNYTLPIATSTELGGIKVGTGLDLTSEGVLNATGVSVDLSPYQQKTDSTLTTTSKEIVGAINENSSQIKEMAKDLLLEDGKLYLKKSDGTKLGVGVILPISVTWETLVGKPTTFTPSSHKHSKSEITDFPTIPTKTSQLTNDSGFLTSHQDLTNYVQKETGKGLSTNDYTTSEKNKLSGLSNYSLPIATTTTLGGIKVGAGLSINNGVLSANGGGTADSVDWSNIQNKPSVFTPSAHSHSYNDLTEKPTIPIVDVTKSYVDTELNKKVDLAGHVLTDNNYTTVEKNKLSGVEANANNYTHPSTHNASIITQDATHRFVSDTEKTNWNGKSTFSGSYTDLTNKPTIPTVSNDLTNALKSNYDNAYTHSQSSHAPLTAQKNSDITKSEIEAKLVGVISTHSHTINIPEDNLVTTNLVGTTLTLTSDKYQTTTMIDGTEIVLPTVSEFKEIHLFFSATNDMTLILPSCKWQSQPAINANKSYELIFTYTTEWLGGCIVYE